MSRARKPNAADKTQPLGNQLRDALARKKATDDAQTQLREQDAQRALGQSLSTWFNGIALAVPKTVEEITRALNGGRSAATDFSYSAADAGISLRGADAINLVTLPGFKKLDETCRDLDVECTVTQGRNGYGRKSGAGQPYLHVNIDAEKPYQPVGVEKVKPGYRR